MPNNRVSPRRVKRLRTYDVREAADATGATTQTVRKWLQEGLAGIRPAIVRGADLIAFLKSREAARKRPCGPGRLYCLRCKAPSDPAFGELEYWPDTAITGSLKGLCATCGGWMVRRTTRARAQAAAGNLSVSFRCDEASLGQTPGARSNHHIEQD